MFRCFYILCCLIATSQQCLQTIDTRGTFLPPPAKENTLNPETRTFLPPPAKENTLNPETLLCDDATWAYSAASGNMSAFCFKVFPLTTPENSWLVAEGKCPDMYTDSYAFLAPMRNENDRLAIKAAKNILKSTGWSARSHTWFGLVDNADGRSHPPKYHTVWGGYLMPGNYTNWLPGQPDRKAVGTYYERCGALNDELYWIDEICEGNEVTADSYVCAKEAKKMN